ncbi:methyltransferase [Vampirovibrio chlorellavorus]|uniref:methyltransferase n=1 Tax=Vampirovibrio chlorellavorus TaxID=758823 RepID=UPI0026F2A90C|nr:methyltransferase [Vampirovibrio chlorellavorus]
MLDVHFWENRYITQNTGWDLAGPSPHFVALIKAPPAFLKPGAMAVLGAGRGHDAALFGQNAFQVSGFDYASSAVQEARQRYGQWADFHQRDIFTLGQADTPFAHQFDYVLEHTCFCAILPKQRPDYLQTVTRLLKPEGYLIGIFWEHEEADGPPFSTTLEAVQALFCDSFDIISVEERQPASNRRGIERLMVLRRKKEL